MRLLSRSPNRDLVATYEVRLRRFFRRSLLLYVCYTPGSAYEEQSRQIAEFLIQGVRKADKLIFVRLKWIKKESIKGLRNYPLKKEDGNGSKERQ